MVQDHLRLQSILALRLHRRTASAPSPAANRCCLPDGWSSRTNQSATDSMILRAYVPAGSLVATACPGPASHRAHPGANTRFRWGGSHPERLGGNPQAGAAELANQRLNLTETGRQGSRLPPGPWCRFGGFAQPVFDAPLALAVHARLGHQIIEPALQSTAMGRRREASGICSVLAP